MKFYSPLEYLKIDIANNAVDGLDRKQFEERIAWVDAHENELEAFEDQADNLYRYAAAVMAYREVQAGKSTGHRVGLDTCASGPQIMSAVMRDIIGAENTSLVGKIRNDVYQKTTDTMNNLLTVAHQYDRKDIKYVLMPHYYGSKKKPRDYFGKHTDEMSAFIEAQATVCPGAAELMPILLNSWNAYAKEHSWVLPDGFVARVKVTVDKETNVEVDELDHLRFNYQYIENEGTEDGVANIANPIQSIDGFIVREITRRCNYNEFHFRRVLALLKKRASQRHLNGVELDSIQKIWMDQNMVSLVDLEELEWDDIKTFDFTYCDQLIKVIRRCINRPSFPIVSIHDEFTAHPNYLNYVRLTYSEIMAEISDSTIIDDIVSKLYGEPMRVKKMAKSISREILNGEYAIS